MMISEVKKRTERYHFVLGELIIHDFFKTIKLDELKLLINLFKSYANKNKHEILRKIVFDNIDRCSEKYVMHDYGVG